MPVVTGEQQISHDVTGEQFVSDSARSGQQFLLAASRPIGIESGHIYGTIVYCKLPLRDFVFAR